MQAGSDGEVLALDPAVEGAVLGLGCCGWTRAQKKRPVGAGGKGPVGGSGERALVPSCLALLEVRGTGESRGQSKNF